MLFFVETYRIQQTILNVFQLGQGDCTMIFKTNNFYICSRLDQKKIYISVFSYCTTTMVQGTFVYSYSFTMVFLKQKSLDRQSVHIFMFIVTIVHSALTGKKRFLNTVLILWYTGPEIFFSATLYSNRRFCFIATVLLWC